MMMTGDDLSLLQRALEKTLKEPVSMFKLPSIPDEMMYILGEITDSAVNTVGEITDVAMNTVGTITDVAMNAVDGAGHVVDIVADHPVLTFVVVAGAIIGVIYVTGGTSHLIAANQIVGQYVSAACQYSSAQASQAATAAYQYSATQASQAVAYLYSFIPSYVTNFVSSNVAYLSTSTQQAVSYAYSLIPAETVKFALGSYNSVINAIAQLYESSQFGTFLRITESRMRAILTPLLKRTSEHIAKHCAKYALTAEVGGISYALTPPAAAGMRVTGEYVHSEADMYREWLLKNQKAILKRLSDTVERKRQAIKEKQTERRLARRAKLQAQLPPDLTPYQECPLTHAAIKEPVRAVLANGVVKFYDREFLANWIKYRIARNLPLVDPTSLLELPYRSADELVVDQEALKIIKIMRELDALGNEKSI